MYIIDELDNLVMMQCKEQFFDFSQSNILKTICPDENSFKYIIKLINDHNQNQINDEDILNDRKKFYKQIFKDEKILNEELFEKMHMDEKLFRVCICSNHTQKEFTFPIYQALHIEKLL